MTGSGWRVNLSTGKAERFDPAEREQQRAEQVRELEREVRLWKWNAEEAKRVKEQTVKNVLRHAAEDRARLARVWALVDPKRKTVRMDALYEALDGDL